MAAKGCSDYQRKSSKIRNATVPPYAWRWELLGLETGLEQRRSKARALFTAKLIGREIDSSDLLGLVGIHAPYRNLRAREFLHISPHRTVFRSNERLLRCTLSFNSFADCLKCSWSGLSVGPVQCYSRHSYGLTTRPSWLPIPFGLYPPSVILSILLGVINKSLITQLIMV